MNLPPLPSPRPFVLGSCILFTADQMRAYATAAVALNKQAVQAVPGWDPIKSAPKDGSRILVGREGHPWTYVCYWCDQHHHWVHGVGAMSFFAEPTHCMPLPAAPAPASTQSQPSTEQKG